MSDRAMILLPFALPKRPSVRQLRQQPTVAAPPNKRNQPLAGFEDRFTDIVDYIVRITDEIWIDRGIGYIYDTYDKNCTIYSTYGVVRSIEEVVAGTVTTLNGYPDGEIHHLNVAWSGDEQEGFYTSHLGHSRSTNLGRSGFGAATGKRTSIRFVADCISRDNRIHTEWLVRDNGAAVRQLGFDPQEAARAIAAAGTPEQEVVTPTQRLQGDAIAVEPASDRSTMRGWVEGLYHDLVNRRRLDWVDRYYAANAIVHAGGARYAQGPRDIQTMYVHVLAAIPDGVLRVEHVCHSEERDGVIVAVRWTLEGRTAPGGVLGECPPGRPVRMMGISHLRMAGARIVEEWMLFDEVGVLVQAYRQ